MRTRKEKWISHLEPYYSDEDDPGMNSHIVDMNDFD